jgi:hypothetical protein
VKPDASAFISVLKRTPVFSGRLYRFLDVSDQIFCID